MAVVGEHIVVELIGVEPGIIDSIDRMKQAVREITRITEVDILNISHHSFQPGGATMVALLSASHISFHTFPEINFISFDYFTCGAKSPALAVDILKKIYSPDQIKVRSLKRGYTMRESHEEEGSYGGFPIEKELVRLNTRAGQDIKILTVKTLGNCLFCNDEFNVAVADEKLFHEPFAARAFEKLHCSNAASVIILGGGDGGIARECLEKHVSEVQVLELDKEVVALCKEHLPSVSAGAFENKKLELIPGDAFETIKKVPSASRDIVFVDLTDYANRQIINNIGEIKRILKPGGVIAARAGAMEYSPIQVETCNKKIRELFTNCEIMEVSVPSFINSQSLAFGVKE
ncbi:MAG: adenosylmethionine decarboxylase [bacterium]|nr:adenosylmethionine decarboxylase [bacterium]